MTKTRTADEAIRIISEAGVPLALINDLHHITTDKHIVGAREMFVDLPHPVIGDMRVNGNPVKLMDTKADISHHAPTRTA